MKTTTITARQLKEGEIFFFNNEEHQISIEDDDIRQAKVLWQDGGKNQWRTGFCIWFNGALLHHSKTFKSMEKRLNILIEKWNLIKSDEL
jgi:hypothetical protein